MQNRRWYEGNPKLTNCIDRLQFIPSFERDRLVHGMMRILRDKDLDLLDQFVMDFPLDIDHHLWYDHDPYLWLVINGLQYAGKQMHARVAFYLEKELRMSPFTEHSFSYLPSHPADPTFLSRIR